jgi:hypothetical protein
MQFNYCKLDFSQCFQVTFKMGAFAWGPQGRFDLCFQCFQITFKMGAFA